MTFLARDRPRPRPSLPAVTITWMHTAESNHGQPHPRPNTTTANCAHGWPHPRTIHKKPRSFKGGGRSRQRQGVGTAVARTDKLQQLKTPRRQPTRAHGQAHQRWTCTCGQTTSKANLRRWEEQAKARREDSSNADRQNTRIKNTSHRPRVSHPPGAKTAACIRMNGRRHAQKG